MNGRDVALRLGCSYQTAGRLLRAGEIKATKGRRCWSVDVDSFKRLQRRNNIAIKRLKEEYADLYWHGVTVEHLQARTRREFERRGIIHKVAGFAEKAIYEDLVARK